MFVLEFFYNFYFYYVYILIRIYKEKTAALCAILFLSCMWYNTFFCFTTQFKIQYLNYIYFLEHSSGRMVPELTISTFLLFFYCYFNHYFMHWQESLTKLRNIFSYWYFAKIIEGKATLNIVNFSDLFMMKFLYLFHKDKNLLCNL